MTPAELRDLAAVARELAAVAAHLARVRGVPPLVLICAWCPDARARTRALIARGAVVNHTICPDCAAQLATEVA